MRDFIQEALDELHTAIVELNLQPMLQKLCISDDETLIIFALEYLRANLDHALGELDE